MGNWLQCCHSVTSYLWRRAVPGTGGGPERSPLLSTDGSDSDWLTQPEDQQDELLTVSGSSDRVALEREHFLFPDIILSSSGVPVEPMVCLLVCEEDEEGGGGGGGGVYERADGAGEHRLWVEVETQTERQERQGVMGVQTQTQQQAEVQTQTDMLTWRDLPATVPEETIGRVCRENQFHATTTTTTTCARLEAQTGLGPWSGERPESSPGGRVPARPGPQSEVAHKMEGHRETRDPQGYTGAESVVGQLNHSPVGARLSLTEPNPVGADVGRHNQTATQAHIVDEGTTGEKINNGDIMLDASTVQFLQSKSITLKTLENVSGLLSEQNESHAERPPVPEEDGGAAVGEGVCGDPAGGHLNKECKGRTEVNVNPTGPADPHASGPGGGIVKTSRDPKDSPASMGQDVAQEEEAWPSNVEVEEQGAEQSIEQSAERSRPEDGGPPAGPRGERGGVKLFLLDRLFLTAPHVKAESSAWDALECSGADQREQDQASIQEVVSLHEAGFTVRIQAPATETFELQVSGQMLVTELHQVLMDHEMTCLRTCFSLQLGGAVLDALTELRLVPGLGEGALVKVVEDPYTVRDARLHLKHVRSLLRSLDVADAHNGANGSSLSYLSLYTRGPPDPVNGSKSRAAERETIDCLLPDYITPGCKDRPLTPLQPIREDWKPLQCLRVLTVNSWNPPPGNRKMHGDLMYLNVVTVEGRDLNITASTRGFYLNQSTAFTFNPKPALPKTLSHSLVELLSQVSPVFRRTFSTLQRKRVLQHPYERIATPYQVYTWVAPHADHALDCVRAEETPASRVGQDEHTVGQSRDWNEELQGCRELPRSSLQERLHRERNIFKTNSDFVNAATQGAIAVVDGNVMAINPGEEPRKQMFIWNNLFFSLGLDTADYYRPLGGDAAAHAAPVCDLRGVQAYASIDIPGLHTLGTALVDYHGHRVTAQAIVPGLLEQHQDRGLLYGSNDHGHTVVSDTKFLDLLGKTCRPLRVQRHMVLDHRHTAVELCSCVQTKGILGNDGRAYILDLHGTFPPDLNFLLSDGGEGVPEECKRLGFPRKHRHSLASLRPELIEAFVQHRYALFQNTVSSGLEKLSADGASLENRSDSTGVRLSADVQSEALIKTLAKQNGGTAMEDMDPQRRQVILEACRAVGSVSDTSFEIRFNPDVCSPAVRIPSESVYEVPKQKQLLWDAAAFLLSNQIPAVVRDFLDHTAVPLDGGSLRLALHQRGVNMRYLGPLLHTLETAPEGERLSHVQRISISEVIIRSAKHIFRIYLQNVEAAALSAAVSHFLNCLLSSASSAPDSADELLSRRRGSRRRRSQGSRAAALAETAWARMTPGDLWRKIQNEAEDYYHYTLHCDSVDEAVERWSLQKISLLREIAMKTGIQVQLRDYVFESRHRPVFSEEDVVNMSPVVKHLRPSATDATGLIQQAQVAVQQGLLGEGYELIQQAMTLFSSVCGIQHEDVSTCLRLLARISYITGEYADALSHQEKAVMCTERVQGIDHPQTIQDYSMLGLVLHGLMNYDQSLKFLQNGLKMTLKYNGASSLKCAHSHHLLATLLESRGDYRLALQHEKEAYSLYRSQAGEDHDSTKESSEYLQTLTRQAVILQRALNHIYSNTPNACTPPPKFSTPSLPMILQQLNITCGILFIPLR
ncbi:unnamed protein product [Arctogadus glacialis]